MTAMSFICHAGLVETGHACVGIEVVDQDNEVVVAVDDRRNDRGAVAEPTVDPNLPGRNLSKTISEFMWRNRHRIGCPRR